MKIIIDIKEQKLIQDNKGEKNILPLYSREAFDIVSRQWLKIGWVQKYSYTFTWMGRPIIQLPEDMVRTQEVIYRVKPDLIIETGIAHGGSLIFYSSLCKLLGKGRVIGIDVEIQPQNRKAIEALELFRLITLIEGNSIAPNVISKVKSLINPDEVVMVFLDSCHTKQHVLSELEAYHDLITPGSYIVATDGIMNDLYDVPRGNSEWIWNNPAAAAIEFVKNHPEFDIEQPAWNFNESELTKNITHWSGAWLRRK